MAQIATALAAGLLFGLGLTISAMTDPAKILAFLDIAGDWDPSLILVMASAIAVTGLGAAIGRRRTAPFCAAGFAPGAGGGIDRRLILGAVLFGIGWGLGGYCPGPALAASPFAGEGTWIFIVFMAIGMLAAKRVRKP